MKNLTPIILVLLFVMSCSNNDSTEDNYSDEEIGDNRLDDEVLTILDNEKALGYFPDSKTPYVFLDENLYTIMAYDQDLDSTVEGVYLKSGDSEALISFDIESYLPTAVTSIDGDLISFYYNEELTSVTVAFHYENQNDEFITIETNPDDLTFSALNRSSITSNYTGTIEAGSLFLRVAGFSSSVVTCLLAGTVAIGGAPVTGGLATALSGPAAILSCSSAVAGFIGFLDVQNPNDQLLPTEIYVLSSTGTVLDTIQCVSGNLFSCLGAATNLGPVALDTLADFLNNLPQPINITGTWTFAEWNGVNLNQWQNITNCPANPTETDTYGRYRYFGTVVFSEDSFSSVLARAQEFNYCISGECAEPVLCYTDNNSTSFSGTYQNNGNNYTVTSGANTTINLVDENSIIIVVGNESRKYIR